MCDNKNLCKVPFKDCIYSRRCFMSGEYCSKQANIQKEREELLNRGEINAFVIMNFSNMSDVVYNWRLKPFIEALDQYLEISKESIYCKESPVKKELTPGEIKQKLQAGEAVSVQKINVIRADTNYASNYVVCNRVCQQMQIADLIILDVSSENTNVFYEFGMAVALGKLILPICYSESFFEIRIPDRLKEYEEEHKEDETNQKIIERIKRHIDCYPWRRALFEHYGIRYRSKEDSDQLDDDKKDAANEDAACGYHGDILSTQYLGYDEAVKQYCGFSDLQYARFPYAEKMPGDSEPIGRQIYTKVAKTYNDSRYEHNTLVVYTMDGFLNAPQANQCISNFYHYITGRMVEDDCFCGDRVGVLIQPNMVPEGVKDAKTRKHLMYGVGEIIHIGMNEATYAAQREMIKPEDFQRGIDILRGADENRTMKSEGVGGSQEKDGVAAKQKAILDFTKNHLCNRSISIYPSTPVYVKRIKNGVQKKILDNVSSLEHGFCLYHLMLRTLAFTNELVVDISQNPLQSLFWLGAAHASNVDAVVVQHEASDQERTVLTGSPEKRERPIFDVAGLWSAIFRSNDTDGFYHQLRLVQEGIEQHSKLMLRNLADYEQRVHEHLYKNTLEDGITKIVQEKGNREAQVLESYYRDQFWKPMLRYEHLRIFIPQSDGMDSRNQYPKLNAVKWDVDAIANLSHYLSKRTHIGQYSFCTLKKNTSAKNSEKGNMIIVGSDARPLEVVGSKAASLPTYIRENTKISDVNISSGENLLHSHMEIERYNFKEKKHWIYKGFVSYSDKHYHGLFSQVPHPKCYECIVPGIQDTGTQEQESFVRIQEKELRLGAEQTANMLWKPCKLKQLGVRHKQLAQLVLWREVDPQEKKVRFWVSMIGASGPATMALSTLLVNESIRESTFELFGEMSSGKNLVPLEKKRLQNMKHPLSDLQAEIRGRIIEYYVREIGETAKKDVKISFAQPSEDTFLQQIKYAAALYLSSVLYRYFLPFLSLEEEKKLTNGMRYFLSSLYASQILTEPQVRDTERDEQRKKEQESQKQRAISQILANVSDALATVLKNFRGVEAMYQVEVEITGEKNSDSRKLLDIAPFLDDGGKSYVNCLSIDSQVSDNNQNDAGNAKAYRKYKGKNTEAEKLTVNLHGREAIYRVTANFLDANIDSGGEIVNIYSQAGGTSSVLDCLCAEEIAEASV